VISCRQLTLKVWALSHMPLQVFGPPGVPFKEPAFSNKFPACQSAGNSSQDCQHPHPLYAQVPARLGTIQGPNFLETLFPPLVSYLRCKIGLRVLRVLSPPIRHRLRRWRCDYRSTSRAFPFLPLPFIPADTSWGVFRPLLGPSGKKPSFWFSERFPQPSIGEPSSNAHFGEAGLAVVIPP